MGEGLSTLILTPIKHFSKQEFARHGYQLIYTPPYQCDTQPIEMLWAYVKNYVARAMGADHSIPTVTELVRQGFYGDQVSNHAPADATLCQSLIQHTHTGSTNGSSGMKNSQVILKLFRVLVMPATTSGIALMTLREKMEREMRQQTQRTNSSQIATTDRATLSSSAFSIL